MNGRNMLRRFYHVWIKRDVVCGWGLKKYGKVGRGSWLYRPSVTPRNKKKIFIGDNTTIMTGSRMQLYEDGTGSLPEIRIGSNCYFAYHNSFLAGGNIVIEDGVLIASDVLISSENHSMDPESDVYYKDQPLICRDVYIGEGTWIGERACILPGVTIGKKCVIGAASVVTKDIPDFSMAAGAPARVIKSYDFNQHEWLRKEGSFV